MKVSVCMDCLKDAIKAFGKIHDGFSETQQKQFGATFLGFSNKLFELKKTVGAIEEGGDGDKILSLLKLVRKQHEDVKSALKSLMEEMEVAERAAGAGCTTMGTDFSTSVTVTNCFCSHANPL